MLQRPISKKTKRQLILFRKDIVENLETFEKYLKDSSSNDYEDLIGLIRRGKVFIGYKVKGEYHFAPSRWCGYYRNRLNLHDKNRGDGKETTPIIDKILHKHYTNAEEDEEDLDVYDILEKKYLNFCNKLGITPCNNIRKYWKFDLDNAKDRNYSEGARTLKIHNSYDRNPQLIQAAKEQAKKVNNGRLVCEICGFDFFDTYGEIGAEFIEGHHIVPLSKIGKKYEATVADIALVCANCHRMLHRGEERTVEDLKDRLTTKRDLL